VPLSSFVAGCEVLKGGLLVGCALMDLTDPGDPELLSDVDEMISAHSARETAVQEDEGGSKKKKREEGRGEQAEAAPRACKGRRVIYRPKAAGFIAAPRCLAFGVRVRVRNAPM
jgi:hypothetical protein